MNDFVIEKMDLKTLALAIDWATQEGWNPGLHDSKCFYAADPEGFFVGKLKGEIIGIGSAVIYDEHFAFCGFYMVKPEFRGKGYGLKITQARLAYVGNRTTGIDGVLNMTKAYANIGYVMAHKNIRYMLLPKKHHFSIPKEVVKVNTIPLQQLLAYDHLYFGASRSAFLTCWIKQPDSFALAFLIHGKLGGYGVMRKCHSGYKIGPLFADTAEIAEVLLQALITNADEQVVYLDVPEPNLNAKKMIAKYQMTEVFTVARMYRNGKLSLNLNNIYGITSFELG